MHELFPLIAGALVGLAVQRIRSARLNVAALVALLVWAGALLASLGMALWRRRALPR